MMKAQTARACQNRSPASTWWPCRFLAASAPRSGEATGCFEATAPMTASCCLQTRCGLEAPTSSPSVPTISSRLGRTTRRASPCCGRSTSRRSFTVSRRGPPSRSGRGEPAKSWIPTTTTSESDPGGGGADHRGAAPLLAVRRFAIPPARRRDPKCSDGGARRRRRRRAAGPR